MLVNTRLDAIGLMLILWTALALARCIWIDVRMTNLVRTHIPDVTSRDLRKWSYLREHFAEHPFWCAEVETMLLMSSVAAVASIVGLYYGDGGQHDRAFGWSALAACVWFLLVLIRDALRKQRLLSRR